MSLEEGLQIRTLETMDEFRACEVLQARVWRMPDARDVVPLHLLVSAQRNGALVLGAFQGEVLVGFLFGYLGRTAKGRLKHCSHMMGIAPELQSQGVGFRLKLAQREWALAQGLDLITWTYDPLEGRNAYLNIHKLGGRCQVYWTDFYGLMDDGLNRGLPSDRFCVDWWIAGGKVLARLDGHRLSSPARPEGRPREARVVLAGLATEDDLPRPGRACLETGLDAVRIQIPANYQAVRTSAADLALEWRIVTREAFTFFFDDGLAVVDFEPAARGSPCSAYLLERVEDTASHGR